MAEVTGYAKHLMSDIGPNRSVLFGTIAMLLAAKSARSPSLTESPLPLPALTFRRCLMMLANQTIQIPGEMMWRAFQF
jgi:hypothetical protein